MKNEDVVKQKNFELKKVVGFAKEVVMQDGPTKKVLDMEKTFL